METGLAYTSRQHSTRSSRIYVVDTKPDGWKEPAVQIEKSDNGPFKHEGTIRIEFVGPEELQRQ